MDVLIMGSCRLGEWEESYFSHNSTKTLTGIAQPSVHTSRQASKTLYVCPTGYSLSLPEHLDLLRVLKGNIGPVPKAKFPVAYNEIHKFSKNELILNTNYDVIFLEVCSRKAIYASSHFKEEFEWGGETIPYTIKDPIFRDNVEKYVSSSRDLSRDDLEQTLQEFLRESGLDPSKIHIVGPYVYTQPHGTDSGLPPHVYENRILFQKDLSSACAACGVNYHDFSEVLQLGNNNPSSLADRFHLSPTGISRLSKYAMESIFL